MDERAKVIIDLIESEMSKQEIKDMINLGGNRTLAFTSGLKIDLKGLHNIGMLEAIIHEQGQPSHLRLFSKMHFGLFH